MSPLNAEVSTVRAICNRFADGSKCCIDDFNFPRRLQIELPGSVVVYGYEVDKVDVSVLPHSWIRVGGRDYDVQLITQRLRAFKRGLSAPPDRVLYPRWNDSGELDDSYVDMHSSGIADWFLPSCAACRGKKRGHTLGRGCTYSRKAEYLERRVAAWESIHNTPLKCFMVSDGP
jgi:hypothetical protein